MGDRSGGAPGGSLWDHCGITVVSLLWDRCGGITVVSLSYHGGTTVCGTTNCCGITMGSSQWDHSRIIVRWYHCGIIVCVWDHCGINVGSLWDHCGIIISAFAFHDMVPHNNEPAMGWHSSTPVVIAGRLLPFGSSNSISE